MVSVEQVDPFVGTDSTFEFSNGNTLPMMALPWGTHHYSPANAEPDGWFFQYRSRGFRGLRLTHAPSPWMGDWCSLTMMPQAGELNVTSEQRSIDVASSELDMKPHRFAVSLPGVSWRAAPTMHSLAMSFAWRGEGRRRLIVDTARSGVSAPAKILVDPERGEIVIRARDGVGLHPNFELFWVLRCSEVGVDGGLFDEAGRVSTALEGEAGSLGCWIEFEEGVGSVDAWAAGSFIDVRSARRLIDQESAGLTVDEVASSAERIWNELLGRLSLPGSSEPEKAMAATMMYRTLLFPRRLDEPDEAGIPQHRCPDTGLVRGGVRVTDNGFWDTARTVYPWYSLIAPDHMATILEGWIEGARATGWLASWASPGHRVCMTGSYSDAVFADAISRGIQGFDWPEALRYVARNALEAVPDGSPFGREALESYLSHGYIPSERIEKSVARTLDYSYGDWCVGQVAAAVGDASLAKDLLARSQNWRNLLHSDSGFFRGKRANGQWDEPFDPFAWGGPYVEGSAWQFAWHVPHHPDELIQARGGPTRARRFLEELFEAPNRFELGTYPTPIHEMREMAAVEFGQYAHSNQPSHFTLPYLAHLGDPAAMDSWTHRVGTDLYQLSPDGLPGDEDNGEMSAWWLLSSLGLHANCPGNGSWMVGSPRFRNIHLEVPRHQTLEIVRNEGAPGGSTANGHDRASGTLVMHEELR